MTYLWTGYLITWVAVFGYAWRLERRAADADEHLGAVRRRERSGPGAG